MLLCSLANETEPATPLHSYAGRVPQKSVIEFWKISAEDMGADVQSGVSAVRACLPECNGTASLKRGRETPTEISGLGEAPSPCKVAKTKHEDSQSIAYQEPSGSSATALQARVLECASAEGMSPARASAVVQEPDMDGKQQASLDQHATGVTQSGIPHANKSPSMDAVQQQRVSVDDHRRAAATAGRSSDAHQPMGYRDSHKEGSKSCKGHNDSRYKDSARGTTKAEGMREGRHKDSDDKDKGRRGTSDREKQTGASHGINRDKCKDKIDPSEKTSKGRERESTRREGGRTGSERDSSRHKASVKDKLREERKGEDKSKEERRRAEVGMAAKDTAKSKVPEVRKESGQKNPEIDVDREKATKGQGTIPRDSKAADKASDSVRGSEKHQLPRGRNNDRALKEEQRPVPKDKDRRSR
jgi:hypothetical protein